MAAFLQQFTRQRDPARLIGAWANNKIRDCRGKMNIFRSVHVDRYVQIRQRVSIPALPRLDRVLWLTHSDQPPFAFVLPRTVLDRRELEHYESRQEKQSRLPALLSARESTRRFHTDSAARQQDYPP
jgi:hypothetical protein